MDSVYKPRKQRGKVQVCSDTLLFYFDLNM